MKILNVFLSATGVIAFFLLFGVVGALENNSIEIGQAVTKAAIYIGYMFLAITVQKNAPKVVRHLKRATKKTIILILYRLVDKVNG